MKAYKFVAAFGLCAAASLFGAKSHAGEVAKAIDAGTLTDSDAVAYMVYGLEDGGRLRLNSQEVATITRVGGLLTSKDPYGFEMEFGRGGPSNIISVQNTSRCKYTVQILAYSASRKVFNDLIPRKTVVNLDFSKVLRTSVVRGSEYPLRSELVALGCTPVENGEGMCDGLAKSKLATAAEGPTLLKTFVYFRNKFCPRQQ